MLPLWIIDLRAKSNRRDFFESLVGKIDHVYIKNTIDSSKLNENSEQSNAASKEKHSESSSLSFGSETSKETISEPTIKEQLETLDKQEADKNSEIGRAHV